MISYGSLFLQINITLSRLGNKDEVGTCVHSDIDKLHEVGWVKRDPLVNKWSWFGSLVVMSRKELSFGGSQGILSSEWFELYEFRCKPCWEKSLKATNWKLKNLMIAINHLLLWESSLVSLKPLEVGELHFQAQAAEGGRPVTFSRIPNQIPATFTF